MLYKLLSFFKRLFGFKDSKSEDLKWLEKKVKESDKKLKDIENEEHTDDSIVDHFNK